MNAMERLHKLAGKKYEKGSESNLTVIVRDPDTQEKLDAAIEAVVELGDNFDKAIDRVKKVVDIESDIKQNSIYIESSKKELLEKIESSNKEIIHSIPEKVELSTTNKLIEKIPSKFDAIVSKLNFSWIKDYFEKILLLLKKDEPLSTEIKKRDGIAYEIVYTFKDKTVVSKIERNISGTVIRTT